ncbi:hypothetical protein BTH42_10255 [Burkholderia sp. SRS-W-2-2016]|uniref:SDR family NAD(P)-dependent oxidoreductase n=1 Tax=Burkholderia sp. SRS-W-2-2016 TaxID=1926878 RepID=UPI00094AA0F3|nr:SDR family oxidoreductase [Burkholderia sp. SRS-W-2-2016]OLL31689.1 hypothetical protein BTH42_10255 [Burkholderia sp. SRS-W-2-2016]
MNAVLNSEKDKVAIVTGAAQGIGRATALRLMRNGVKVVAVDRQADGLATLRSEAPDQVEILELDVTSADAPDTTIATAMDKFGRVDALVNNAGIGIAKPVHLTTDEEFDRFMNINLRSVFRFTRAALGVMKAGATIVNVASTFGLMGNPNASSYAATKAALMGLTRQMVADYGPTGIRVNAVAPGVIVTDMVKGRLETSEYFRKLMVETTPYTRLGTAEDVANVIAFLCSDESGYVNGHVLTIDGGWSAANFVPQGA